MNLSDFRYVVTVAETGSYSKAAAELFITQPALSQRVKHIEQVYGVSLFHRDRSGMVLTEDGKIFVKHARELLQCETALRAEFAKKKLEHESVIQVGISYAIADFFYQYAFPYMCTAFPDVQFNIVEQSSPVLEKQLLSDKVDFMICYSEKKKDELCYSEILTDRFVLLPAANSALEKDLSANAVPGACISPQILNGNPVSICIPGRFLHQYVEAVIAAEHINPDIRFIGESLNMLYSAAEAGTSSAFLYESFLLKRPHRPYYYLDSQVKNALPLALVWKKDSAYKKFADGLTKSIQIGVSNEANSVATP